MDLVSIHLLNALAGEKSRHRRRAYVLCWMWKYIRIVLIIANGSVFGYRHWWSSGKRKSLLDILRA